jgi:hypothetical protein
MEELIPKLKSKGIIPMSREEARAMGEKGTRAAAAKADQEHQRRLDIIAHRLDEYMKELAPFVFKVAFVTGWTWLFRALGYGYKVEGSKESVQGIPGIACTRIYVQRKWFYLHRTRYYPVFEERTVKAERLVWEVPKPPKSKIIIP